MALLDNIAEILDAVGISYGDHVLVYSNTASLAKIVDVRSLQAEFGTGLRNEMLVRFHEAISRAVGPTGTILSLGSFTDYARFGTPYHVDKSLPDQSLGAYPRYLFSRPGASRSYNPTSNLIGLGHDAATIAVKTNATAYGLGTPWEQLIVHRAKIVFWDTTLRPMTFGHHIEQCVGVPHVYSKIYDTPIFEAGARIPFDVITSVRYLDFDVKYNMQRMETELKQAGLARTYTRNTLTVDVVECPDLAVFLTQKLAVSPYYLLDAPPKFRKGVVPFDGNAGPENLRLANVKYVMSEGS
jgi:aminoglycoside 3-N-acetyltransferase